MIPVLMNWLKCSTSSTKKVAEKVAENATVSNVAHANAPVKQQGLTERFIERASKNGEKLSENKIDILTLMIDKS